MTSKDGLMTTTNPDNNHHIAAWNKICDDYKAEEDRWVANLVKDGYKAIHPNDGWVDRDNKQFQLVYPRYDAGLKIGDKVMLGSHTGKNNMTVKVTGIYTSSMFDIKMYTYMYCENFDKYGKEK